MFAKIHLNDSRINHFQAFVLHMLGKIQTLKKHWRTISTYTSTPPNSSRWTSLRYVSFAIQTESLARSYITVAEHAIDVSKWLAYCVVEACHSGVFFFLFFFSPTHSHGLNVVGVTMWRLEGGLTPGGFQQSVFSTQKRMWLNLVTSLVSTPDWKK